MKRMWWRPKDESKRRDIFIFIPEAGAIRNSAFAGWDSAITFSRSGWE
ncbi:hypothetical protein DSLASN_28800 [Desulfoluna limicola]|uniref:Uncharacterized protein n=1 Tax=Desulfoluna limicola TaxID=2810562 RepID=A0ABN6F5I4_9BACT|nr:hypothetical protein DSLASN_28800 [Desulfoluna limicola]